MAESACRVPVSPVVPDPAWVERLRAVADECRDFAVDARRAEREFGIDADLARALIAQGLPHARTSTGTRFTAMDLHYVALRIGCAEVYLDAMRRWADALSSSSASDAIDVKISYVPYASPGSAVTVLEPQGYASVSLNQGRVATTVVARIAGQWPALESSLAPLLTEIASLDFCRLPDSLAADTRFVRETRLADCAAASKLLVEECALRGVRARTAYGLLVASPYSTTHNWAEIWQGRRWLPADPLLLALLVRYAGLDPVAWPPTRSPGGVLLRLAEASTPLVEAAARAVDTTFLTKIDPVCEPRPAVAAPQRLAQ